jgi:hypothetical protein
MSGVAGRLRDRRSGRHEWNCLRPGNDWRGSRDGFDRNAFVRTVERMRSEVAADPAKRLHYDETLSAINRMVLQMHNEWTRKPAGPPVRS